MCEQTRQQIAGDLEYAIAQLKGEGHQSAWTAGTRADLADRAQRALDALERIQSYLARADLPQALIDTGLAMREGEERGVWRDQ